MRKRVAVLTGMFLALSGCVRPATAPHLVLITADALRADHLSLYGYPRATSPRLDAFARESFRFDQAISLIPKTAPSFATMFTGRHPEVHGVRSNFARIPATLPMLAEQLRDAGYHTVAFVSNPALRERKGFDRGFDRFQRFPEKDGVADVNRAYLAFAGEAWDRPTFVWIHYIDPHGPYEPPPAYEKLFRDDDLARSGARVPRGYTIDPDQPNKVLGAVPRYQQRADREDRVSAYVARYDAEIRYVDDAFGAVIDDLRARGRYDASAVIFTSDHGESLGEHDLYFEHGWFAYDTSLRVPLFVKAPGRSEGRQVDTPASNLDLRPTLLALAGLPVERAPGRDLLAGGEGAPHVLVESSDLYPEKFHGARSARWKYLRRAEDGREELYDLAADPQETRNLADEQPQRRQALADFVATRLAELRANAVAPGVETPDDPETLEQLRELGYVQ